MRRREHRKVTVCSWLGLYAGNQAFRNTNCKDIHTCCITIMHQVQNKQYLQFAFKFQHLHFIFELNAPHWTPTTIAIKRKKKIYIIFLIFVAKNIPGITTGQCKFNWCWGRLSALKYNDKSKSAFEGWVINLFHTPEILWAISRSWNHYYKLKVRTWALHIFTIPTVHRANSFWISFTHISKYFSIQSTPETKE